MSERTSGKRELAPPYAALELDGDRTLRCPTLARGRFGAAARWERAAIAAPAEYAAALSRIARACLTGSSPRTRHGRWRRDLAYLEAVEAEARATLPSADHQKYADMVAGWRLREPRGVLGRYLAIVARKRGEAREPAP